MAIIALVRAIPGKQQPQFIISTFGGLLLSKYLAPPQTFYQQIVPSMFDPGIALSKK